MSDPTEQPEPEERRYRFLNKDLIAAVARLDPAPRRQVWTSLSYCVIDAVWSIGATYSTVVAPLVHRVADHNQDPAPLIESAYPLPDDPLPLEALLDRYPSTQHLCEVTNRQRTSPRGGILKAEATLRYATILLDHGATDLTQTRALLDDALWAADLDAALVTVSGEGSYGVRRRYLWMLCGRDDVVKPDRMVLRWLKEKGLNLDPGTARTVLCELAAEVTRQLGRPVTPWMVDHAIWLAAHPSRPGTASASGCSPQ